MKPKTAAVITPSQYFKIAFGCSNRAFYKVKSELYDIADKIGIEIQDGFITEKCDYEGDLEEIFIYNTDEAEHLIQSVFAFYNVPIIELPEDMDVALTIF